MDGSCAGGLPCWLATTSVVFFCGLGVQSMTPSPSIEWPWAGQQVDSQLCYLWVNVVLWSTRTLYSLDVAFP